MTIEQSTKDVIASKLQDGTVEKLVERNFEKSVDAALGDLFSSYGDITKIIKDKLKSILVPYIENYNYSDYIIKLDDVLVEVLKHSSFDNKTILENFKDLMTPEGKLKIITVSELFERWTKYVTENVSTDDLEVITDDGVYYQNIDVKFEVDFCEGKSWDSYEYGTIYFECEQDEEVNFSIGLKRWKERSGKGWDIQYDKTPELRSLKILNEFELLIMKLAQNYTEIIIDEEFGEDEVRPKAEPEATFS
ncbi:hypothetical protein ABHN03_03830 [Paenibacillus sp. NRS-1775]|uniref:hypothetical protein n=1 Tax=unclassified Paenibacillus TaxID=185978 RepID=UPI003D268D3B